MSRYPRVSILLVTLCILLLCSPASAFGAGNIASISKIEGQNWRHGDLEDLLKTVPFLAHHKWTSLMIKRAYFGNWLRDYSQAVDVGTLKGVQAGTIRILVWVLSFLSFGYATGEFEVTEERLGVYRPEEHIDNPKDYADNADARQFDPRLRPPVTPAELAVDPYTGMKNYISHEAGHWATSSGYVKFSFSRSIHFGRVYTSGASGSRGREADLCEALRCLGQGLHCLEDFAAHTNYVELALREIGLTNVFPHTGVATEMNLHGRRVFPLVTGTFGAVDFLHSVLGEATDHFAQTEIDEMDIALGEAQKPTKPSKPSSVGAQGGSSRGNGNGDNFIQLLSQLPGAGGNLSQEARSLKAAAEDQERLNAESGYSDSHRAAMPQNFSAPPGSMGGPPGPGIPGMSPNFDPVQTAARIYPILAFRDRVVKAISATLEKVPGLQALCDRITETITLFVLSLLAPFIRPIIKAVTKQLKEGSSAVVDSSGRHQFEPWTNPQCTDPTHSLLSKDHFSNVLNEVAGQVAAVIVKYVAPRVIYAWSHPDVPVQQVLDDVVQVFHHPAIRNQHNELHRNMYDTVRRWAERQPNRGSHLNTLLGSESVKNGRNHRGDDHHGHGHGHGHGMPTHQSSGGHSKVRGSEWERVSTRGMEPMGPLEAPPMGGPMTSEYMAGPPPPPARSYEEFPPPQSYGEEYPRPEPSPYAMDPYAGPAPAQQQPPPPGPTYEYEAPYPDDRSSEQTQGYSYYPPGGYGYGGEGNEGGGGGGPPPPLQQGQETYAYSEPPPASDHYGGHGYPPGPPGPPGGVDQGYAPYQGDGGGGGSGY
ncbi:MAG: hypothetical protein M1823_004599 [Watsoniomyces obsoletus]|nr:MAG: hypothetical protein M1823_004599 [Watsoniomyces obsoletus]